MINKNNNVFESKCFHTAKLHIFSGISKKYLAIVYAEDAAVANLAALAGGKQLDVAPTSVKIVSQGDTVSEFEYRAVGFPNGDIHRGAAVKHSASGGNVYCF